jgi:hypothetical protein
MSVSPVDLANFRPISGQCNNYLDATVIARQFAASHRSGPVILALYVLAAAILILSGTQILVMTKAADAAAAENAALDRLTASTAALTDAVAVLTAQAAATAAELRSIAADTGDNDQTIRINALADLVDGKTARGDRLARAHPGAHPRRAGRLNPQLLTASK